MTRWLLLPLLLLALGVEAATFSYRVEIDGLSSSRAKLLKPQLDIEAWHDSPEMNLEQLQRLHAQTPERLQELLATLGYFNAQIEPELKQDDGTWLALYHIDPGEQAHIGTLTIEFEGAIAVAGVDPDGLARRRSLQRRWPLQADMPFTQNAWREGKKLLLENLTATNYPYARLKSSSAVVSDDGRRVNLHLVLASGPRMRFGVLKVSGLSTYPQHTVSNLNTIEPGTNFNREALLDYQSRLTQSGYFAGVMVDIQNRDGSQDLDSASAGVADILVQVSELKQQQVRLGVGYSTDSRERVQIGYEHRNIFHRGWRWSALIKADQRDQSLSSEIAFPAGADLYQDSIGYSIEHQSIENSDTYANRVYAKRHWGDSHFERTLSLEVLDELTQKPVLQSDGSQPTRESETVTTSLAYIWIKRDVNDLVLPTRGQIRHVEGLIGSKFELSPYLRLYGRWNVYRPLGRKWLFLGRGEIGNIFGAVGNVPADYLFLSGGDNTIRGYPYQSVGMAANSTTLGSKTMTVLSGELQYWFTSKWGGAAFFDAGSLGPELMRSAWQQGYGVGLRWRSPVGPLNLDYAWGRQIHDYQIHFSIGLAF